MARPKHDHTPIGPAPDLHPALVEAADLSADTTERVQALAVQLQYDGALSDAALLDGIRAYMRRTVDDCLQLGIRLALLREQCPHGTWALHLERVGISQSAAKRFVAAALKVAKSPKLGDLVRGHAKSQAQMLELLVLEDDAAAELLETGSLGDLRLDHIDTAPSSELRRMIRDALADGAAKDKVLAAKSAEIDRLQTERAKLEAERDQRALLVTVETLDPDTVRDQLIAELTRRALHAEAEIRGQLRPSLAQLRAHLAADGRPAEAEQAIAGAVGQVAAALDELRWEYGLRQAAGAAARIPGADGWDAIAAEAAADPAERARREHQAAVERLAQLRQSDWSDADIEHAWPGLLGYVARGAPDPAADAVAAAHAAQVRALRPGADD
jgi:hypothetical protein